MNALEALNQLIITPYQAEKKLQQKIKFLIEKNAEELKGNLIAFCDVESEITPLDYSYNHALDLIMPLFTLNDVTNVAYKAEVDLNSKTRNKLIAANECFFYHKVSFAKKIKYIKTLIKTLKHGNHYYFFEHCVSHILMTDLLQFNKDSNAQLFRYVDSLDLTNYETSLFALHLRDTVKINQYNLTPFVVAINLLLGNDLNMDEVKNIKKAIENRMPLYFSKVNIEYRDNGSVKLSLSAKDATKVKDLIAPYMLNYKPYWF